MSEKKYPPKHEEHYFRCLPEDLDYIRRNDPKLGAVIDAIGPIRRRIYPEPFSALLRIVIGQQISSKVQEALWLRFQEAIPVIDPPHVAALALPDIQKCGLSRRKSEYILGIANSFANGEIDIRSLGQMDNHSFSQTLKTLRGVGQWTADMLMLFSFQRPDIMSYDDLGIRRGMMRLYGHESLSHDLFYGHYSKISRRASLASMYLWEVAASNPAIDWL